MIRTSRKQVVQLGKELNAINKGINIYDYLNNLESYMNELYEQADFERAISYRTIAYSNNGYGVTSRLDSIIIFENGEWNTTGIFTYFE